MQSLSSLAMSTPRHFRLLTYNVHRCLGTDRVISPHRIATVIAATGADVVALQELDVNRARSGHVDQAQLIAALLEIRWWDWPEDKVLRYAKLLCSPDVDGFIAAAREARYG